MSKKIKEVCGVWKKIYSNWKYSFALLIIALLFYAINALIQNRNYRTILDFFSLEGLLPTIKLSFSLFIGLFATMETHSFISLLITSLLVGMLFTVIAYKTRASHNHGQKDTKQGILAGIGVFLGVAAPGCAACGVGLLALLGVGGTFLAALPFHGLEVSIAAIILLIISIYYISKSMLDCKVCKVKLDLK